MSFQKNHLFGQNSLNTDLLEIAVLFFLSRLCCLLFSLILLSSCGARNFNYTVHGADEFVMDSYRIREGKLSILEMEGKPLAELPDDAMEEVDDVIFNEDILDIAVYHPSRTDLIDTINRISQAVGFRVVDGKIDIPDLPPVEIAGHSLLEAKTILEAKYHEQIQDIEVFLAYRDRLYSKVDLSGMVGSSYIPIDGKVRLYEVLAKARVPNSANLYKSYVMRNGEPLAVDLHRLRNLGDMRFNIVMRPGDKIFIADPQHSRVMVMGEVNLPQPVNVPYGSISLREALVSAKGIPYTGNRQAIQVIRGNLMNPKVYLLSWEHIVNLPNDSLLLMPGDTIYVTEKPITKWNRLISQALPSFSGIQGAYGTYKLLGS